MNKIAYSCLTLYLAATTLIAQPVKSNIGGNKVKNISNAQQNYTAADYVQDGLIILIDGIENAGWGIHDPNAKVTDLISGTVGNVFIGRNPEWNDNALTNGCCQFKYPMFKNVFEQIRDADCLTGEFCTMLRTSSTSFVILTPRIVLYTTENMEQGFVGYSINRYSTYWNIATKGINRRDDGTYCDWNTTPQFQYMTGHTITVGYDSVNLLSILHCDGQFIRSISGGPFSLHNIQVDNTYGGFWYAWVGLPAGNDCYCYRLYSRKLTDAEIQWNYKVDKVRFGLK